MASYTKHKAGLIKFLIGIAALSLFLIVLAAGVLPADHVGGVVGHNIKNKIDATPLFYTESDELTRIEKEMK